MTRRFSSIFGIFAGLAAMGVSKSAHAVDYPADPIFDFKQIIEEPLDAKLLEPGEKDNDLGERDGVIVEKFEFTSMTRDGKPDRVTGLIAYPKGGKNLPAIFWSQGGMAAANTYFPRIFAAKGYVCCNVTLDHRVRGSWAKFDAADPKNANLTRLATDQMRAITYLSQRPEVDPDRIAVGGASYGGFFATLIAGADPRIKAGMSYFAAGHHEMGTNLPQFNGMGSAEEVATWVKTIDPAWRLTKKKVPFLWGIASNDNWFHLPAVIKTYEESIGDKRALIWPQWQHGFPEHVDHALIDWYDTTLKKERRPYNQAGVLQVKNEGGKLVANWDWTGENPVKKAELIVAYGRVVPWRGWVYRHHEIFPATINGNHATAQVPLPEKDLEAYVYANITDDKDVIVSTVPVTVKPAALGVTAATAPDLVVNGAFYGDFEPVGMQFLAGCLNVDLPADTVIKHSGAQSLKVATTDIKKPVGATLKLHHIPEHSHTLKVWLRTDAATTLRLTVTGPPPANWKSKAADIQRRAAEAAAGIDSKDVPEKAQQFTSDIEVGTEWKEYTLAVPYDGNLVEGYNLTVKPVAPAAPLTFWVDDLRFEPVWEK